MALLIVPVTLNKAITTLGIADLQFFVTVLLMLYIYFVSNVLLNLLKNFKISLTTLYKLDLPLSLLLLLFFIGITWVYYNILPKIKDFKFQDNKSKYEK